MSICETLLDDPFAFETVTVRSSFLVVDSEDFIEFILGASTECVRKDYIHFANTVSIILRRLKKCDIIAIFVIPGFTSPARERESNSNHLNVLVSLLAYSDVQHIVVEHPLTAYSASLAVYLKAPLLASKRDYLFAVSDTHYSEGDLNAALSCMLIERTEINHLLSKTGEIWNSGVACTAVNVMVEKDCHFSGQVFRPDLSVICRVKPPHRPLLALLVGLGRQTIKSPVDVKDDGLDTPTVRLTAMIEWLSGFAAYSLEPLLATLNCYAAEERRERQSQLINEYCRFYYDPQSVGTKLAAIVNIDGEERKFNRTQEVVGIEKIFRVCQEMLLKEITNDWSPSFTSYYQKLKFLPSLLTPLHDLNGVSFYHLKGKLGPSKASRLYLNTVPLRYLCYRLLYGQEHCLMNANLTERLIEDNIVLKYGMTVKPLTVNVTQDITETFTKMFNISVQPKNIKPDWMFSLALSLAIWCQCGGFDSAASSDITMVTPDEASLLLAAGAVAIVNVQNLDHLTTALPTYYEKLIGFLQRDVADYKNRACPASRMDDNNFQLISPKLKDQFAAMQLHYVYLTSLLGILNCSRPIEADSPQSSILNVLPSWVAFPSSRLVYWLTLHLDNQPASIRRDHIIHYWLPRLLLRSRVQEQQETSLVARQGELFKRLLQLIKSLLPLNLDESLPDVSVCNLSGGPVPEHPIWLTRHTASQPDFRWIRGCTIDTKHSGGPLVSDRRQPSQCETPKPSYPGRTVVTASDDQHGAHDSSESSGSSRVDNHDWIGQRSAEGHDVEAVSSRFSAPTFPSYGFGRAAGFGRGDVGGGGGIRRGLGSGGYRRRGRGSYASQLLARLVDD